MIKEKVLIILLVLTLLGGFLRLYEISKNPISLNVDEASIGYNAYSILKTGKDEYGVSYPIVFKSLGDFKPPFYIYLTAISISVFDLNEFAVRFPSALLGTLSIPLIYFLILSLTRNQKYALMGASLLAVSAWHIYFSRVASEAIVATFLTSLGILGMLKMKEGKMLWGVIAAFTLATSMYTYHSQRLFVPLIVLIFLSLNFKELKTHKTKILIFLVLLIIFVIPLVNSVLFGSSAARAQMTLITNDVELLRTVWVEPNSDNLRSFSFLSPIFGSEVFLLIFYWARKFLAYFQPSFLFYQGLGMTAGNTYGLGVLYLFEVPFFLLGIYKILTLERKVLLFIIGWILAGIIPASITLNEQHPIRAMSILPMLVLISAVGGVELFSLIHQKLTRIYRYLICLGLLGLVVWNLIFAFVIFAVHFPNQKGEGLMEGTKESILYALNNLEKFDQIVYDPVRGVDGPYLVNAPHAYILFYSKYDPQKYQDEIKREGDGSFGFGKFTVRSIYWPADQSLENSLFIGSPWSLPLQDLKEGEIIHRVYLSNGKLALLLVSPKKSLR